MPDPILEPDPRRKRAFILGGALLGAIVLWQGPWWGDDDDHVVITTEEAESGAEISAPVDDEVREAGIEEADVEETVNEAVAAANETGADDRTIRTEGDDGSGVTISVNPVDGNDEGR